jgi:hypothetical protein
MGTPRHHARALAERLLAPRAEFRSEYLDFERGIRVGHLEPSERITQILKGRLADAYGIRFICDRWGRGVHWQWICWVPEPNRSAKPLSSAVNFGSAKFFVAIDREERVFQSGMQVERAPVRPGRDDWPIRLERDWDWHVFVRALEGDALPRVLRRLLRDGFRIRLGPFSELIEYDRRTWDLAECARRTRFPPREWGGFQLFWPMTAEEVAVTPGPDLIDAVLAVFAAVAPAMDLCMYAPCLGRGSCEVPRP